jgi:superfamily II DNA or RNA helicase
MFTLEPHQQQVIDDNKDKVGLFFDRGIGKTVIALSMAQGKTLVVCKKQQKDEQSFLKECIKFNLTVDLTVLTRDEFRKLHKTLAYFDTLIIDEADQMLNGAITVWRGQMAMKSAGIAKALKWYIKNINPKRVYPATATILRTPVVLFNTAYILGVEWNIDEYIKTYYYIREGKAKVDTKKEDKFVADARSLGYTGSHKKYKYVPEQVIIPVFLPLTDEQRYYINDVITSYSNTSVQLSKMYQVHNGLLNGNQFSETIRIKNNKTDYILNLAKQHKQMIIFAQHTEQIEELQEILKDYKLFVLTGKTKKRKELNEEAKKTAEYIFIAQSTISAGWELPECPVTVFASGWVADDTIQGEGRVQRGNNLKENIYYYIMTDTSIDRALYKKLETKKRLYEKLHE